MYLSRSIPRCTLLRRTGVQPASRTITSNINGKTRNGSFGVPYQIDVLNSFGLKAVFLVESLFASAVGKDRLQRIVSLVHAGGHEVQMHLHSEWLAWMPESTLPGRTGEDFKDFTLDEQSIMIAQGIDNLRSAGAENICAFRAGNYGANRDTLRALARNGIRYDTSYNYCYTQSSCALDFATPLLQPAMVEGLYENFRFRSWGLPRPLPARAALRMLGSGTGIRHAQRIEPAMEQLRDRLA